jgi:hypothetical protein
MKYPRTFRLMHDGTLGFDKILPKQVGQELIVDNLRK